jgi:hypothetical protein
LRVGGQEPAAALGAGPFLPASGKPSPVQQEHPAAFSHQPGQRGPGRACSYNGDIIHRRTNPVKTCYLLVQTDPEALLFQHNILFKIIAGKKACPFEFKSLWYDNK